MNDNITRVIRFMTSDKREWPSQEEACIHEQMLENTKTLSLWIERNYGESPCRASIVDAITRWELTKAHLALAPQVKAEEDAING